MASEIQHNIHDEEHTLPDGHKVYKCVWKPNKPTIAHLLYLHGFSDHCHAYNDFFCSLSRRGIEVTSFDQRGWGKSSLERSLQGKTGTTQEIIQDIDYFLGPLFESGLPVFLGGHSAGGALCLVYGHSGPQRGKLAGLLCESPFIDFAPESMPFPGKQFIGRLVSLILPNLQIPNVIPKEWVSRDPKVQNSFHDDELCHDTGTLAGLREMLDRCKFLQKSSGEGWDSKVPFVIWHGTADKITSHTASEAFTKRLVEKGIKGEYVPCEGWYHKMHADGDEASADFERFVGQWIEERVNELKG